MTSNYAYRRQELIPRLVALALNPGAWKALLTWPKFSVASFEITSDLRNQGIVPDVVIDVGANVGQFGVASSKTFGGCRVHSFEPQPDTYAQLARNTASTPQITTHNMALGRGAGTATFNVNAHSHSSSMLPLASRHVEAFPEFLSVKTIEVKVSTLDIMMEKIEPTGIVLLKLDVQGFEAEVLGGAAGALKRIDYVLLEASLKPMYEGEALFPEIMELMTASGFAFLRPLAWLKDPKTGEVLQMDVLFGRVDARPG
ncbi:FkbM family methyltransferase [Nevskia sp.]|uniref:FkbM family methyltransferase n=1 Tax=Nevskia sp. TaxID=1929292 RepID=UPI0025F899BF|nr:FkbM family methyltransferase [Nevskia sp.]